VAVADAGDDFLVLGVQFSEAPDHELVALVDEDALDGGVPLPDLIEVGVVVILVFLEFLFHAFSTDEEPCNPREHEFEFLD